MKATPKRDQKDYISTAIKMFMANNLIWLLCYFGQQVTSESEKLFEAIYECQWYEQSPNFKKKLMIMQTVCAQQINLKTVKFTLNRENFYKVINLH